MLRVGLRPLLVVSMTAWLAMACGGDDDGGSGGDGGAQADARWDDFADAASEVCTDFAELDLGALDPIPDATAVRKANPDPPEGNADARTLQLTGTAASGTKPDIIQLELWDGLGAFSGGDAAPGTYPIEGDETTVVTCGICIYIWADATVVDGVVVDSEKDYIATGGSITIDSVDGNFTGSLSGLTFTEIDQTSENGDPLPGGCQTAIPSATFDVAIDEQ
jgi:hypothetical protein